MCARVTSTVEDVRAWSGVRRVAGDSAFGSTGDVAGGVRARRRRQRRRALHGVYRSLS